MIKNEGIPALTGDDIDYVTVNGVKTPLNELPLYYVGNKINIVYHLKAIDEKILS